MVRKARAGRPHPQEAALGQTTRQIVNCQLVELKKKINFMSTTTKKETWKLIIQLIVSIATAIATTIGVTSCMGANRLF